MWSIRIDFRNPWSLEQHLGFSIAGTKLAASRFLPLGFCSCVAFGDCRPYAQITTLGLADASLESTNFWDCPFDLWVSALAQQRITNWQNQTISSKSGRETLQRRPRRKKRSSASSGSPIHLRLRWRQSKSL